MGLALANQGVTVNGVTPWRKGEYFRRELTLANNSAPLWTSVSVNSGSSTVSGNTFTPKTPEPYTYDLDGNLLTDGRWNYTWDAENRLIKMSSRTDAPFIAPVGSERHLTFQYDHQSRRIGKKVWNNTAGNGNAVLDQRFVYDGWNLLAILDPQSSLLASFTWGTDLSGSAQGAGGVGGLLEPV